jgi:dolichol-phosphate mannosyltransferase
MSDKSLLIIPTYNERENIEKLITEVFSYELPLDILIVDDNSPDGTGQVVKDLKAKYSDLHLLERSGKLGLGTAYVAGFKFALARDYRYIMQMDADFSHNPRRLYDFLAEIKNADVVIGSRYSKGVNVINWPLSRLILSYGANMYTRLLTGMPLYDSTGGFKCFRREVLEAIPLDRIRSNGYSFQIEMNFRAWKRKFKLIEIPIVFNDRQLGESKMSKKIVFEAVWMVWKLAILSWFGRY